MLIETEQFKQMISYHPLAENRFEQNKVKMQLLQPIKEFFGDKFFRMKKGTRQAIDYIAWHSTERGFIFASQLYIGKRYGISDRTVRSIMRQLEEAGIVYKAYRRNPNGNSKGKPIYFFTGHKYFTYWKKFLNIHCQEDFQEENGQNAWESKEENEKKVSTLYLPQNYIKQDIYNKPSFKKALKMAKEMLNRKNFMSKDQETAMYKLLGHPHVLDSVKEDAYRIALKLPRHMNKNHWSTLDHTLMDFAYIEGKKSTPQYFKSIFENRYDQYVRMRTEKEKQLPVYPDIDWLGVSQE